MIVFSRLTLRKCVEEQSKEKTRNPGGTQPLGAVRPVHKQTLPGAPMLGRTRSAMGSVSALDTWPGGVQEETQAVGSSSEPREAGVGYQKEAASAGSL